jgi:hypothetical protein
LIELNERQGAIAGIVVNRLWSAVGTLLHDAEYDLAELQQIAMMNGAWLLNSHAIHKRAIRATKVAKQHPSIDHREFGMVARNRWARNVQ